MNSVLSIRDLGVSYGAVSALRGVDVLVEQHETVAVLGANGAGKSTLLRTISGLTRAHKGEIRYCGQSIERLSPSRIAGLRIGHVPEGRNVFPELSVEQNLIVGAHRLRKGPNYIRNHVLPDVYDLFPRLAERAQQPAVSLSGGEQQMLALGRALVSDPEFLMLDEPSLGLAPIIVARVFEAIREMQKRGLTMLLVEQNASVALKHCDRAYVLSLGEVVTEGTGNELLRDPAVQGAYLGGDDSVTEVRESSVTGERSALMRVRHFRRTGD